MAFIRRNIRTPVSRHIVINRNLEYKGIIQGARIGIHLLRCGRFASGRLNVLHILVIVDAIGTVLTHIELFKVNGVLLL